MTTERRTAAGRSCPPPNPDSANTASKARATDRIYLDFNASTPLAPEVVAAMAPFLTEGFGNPSSPHWAGAPARDAVEAARLQVAMLIGCDPTEVVFTSGGTEANNHALKGVFFSAGHRFERPHFITTQVEHPAILEPCRFLQGLGAEVTYLCVDRYGQIDPDEVRRAICPETVLVSVMHANNELGTVQPVAEISRFAREAGITMHSDGVQAVGRIPTGVNALGVDLYSLSGHKIYAPKGVGALFVRKGTRLDPILHGGHHERERRPGTENVAGAAALGFAAGWMQSHWASEAERLRALRDRLEQGILARVPHAFVNGRKASRTPNTANICFEGVEGEAMVIALDLKGFAVSTGAACSSGAVEPSHVLTAIGLPTEKAKASLRFSLGRSNTVEQVDALIEAVVEAAEHLRKLSPTYPAHV